MTTINNSPKNKNTSENQEPQTTGHSWDGIQEYNTPAPRWWLIVWLITIIWSIIYWIFFPTWPTISGNTKGVNNWSGSSQLMEEQAKIDEKQQLYLDKFSKLSFEQIKKDPELMEFALNGGQAAFKENCAACHGTGAQGSKGFPNLNDDDWLWGGKIEDIYTTLQYGIRANHPKTRNSVMPSFGIDQILTKNEIKSVAEYVMSLSGNGATNAQGQEIFTAQCAICHGANAKGGREFGAPNLTDAIWLYGKNPEDIIYTITYSRAGVMPNWGERLDDNTIKQLSIYVHSLGGGE
jgi:cytochrome c oxidase cbb3-type subunit 3